jgi:phage tail-like protein
MATADKRGYVAGKYGVELDGILAGWVWSCEGGHAVSEVVQEKLGPDHIIKKHIAGVKYEDITVTCGTGMSKGFYNWIKDSFDHKYTRKNGAIIAADYNYKEHSRLTFTNALVTEIGFPALDAASKDAAKMTIKLSPEITRQTQTSGGPSIAGKFAIDQKVQKKWLPANFRLRVDGLDLACARVNKIEAIVVKQKVIEHAVGEFRDYEKEPAHLEVPNLVITFPESHADEVYKWHENFVIKGVNGDDQEKSGQLEYLTPDLKEVLFTLQFQHLGIFKLTPEKVESGSEQIRRLKAEMYCEDMKFDYKAAWA